MDRLKLVALDEEDLAILSAHLQDAVLKVGDMTYMARDKRFALVVNRFDWAGASKGLRRRRRTGVHFDRVLKVQASRLRMAEPDAVVNLLAVIFTPGEPPSGRVTLVFSGGAALRLEVECLEAQMSDLGPVWETQSTPVHDAAHDPAHDPAGGSAAATEG